MPVEKGLPPLHNVKAIKELSGTLLDSYWQFYLERSEVDAARGTIKLRKQAICLAVGLPASASD